MLRGELITFFMHGCSSERSSEESGESEEQLENILDIKTFYSRKRCFLGTCQASWPFKQK